MGACVVVTLAGGGAPGIEWVEPRMLLHPPHPEPGRSPQRMSAGLEGDPGLGIDPGLSQSGPV